MRQKFALFVAALMASSTTASAQDVVVTQVLQRVCIPFMQFTDQKPIDVAEAAARSLNLRQTQARENTIGAVHVSTMRSYSLGQSNGTYTVDVIDSGYGQRSCTIVAPAGVQVPHLQQAVSNAVNADWAVEFEDSGPAWLSYDDYGEHQRRITAGLSVRGSPAVWVRMEEYYPDE